MIAHNCQGGGWDTYAVYTNFTGRFASATGRIVIGKGGFFVLIR